MKEPEMDRIGEMIADVLSAKGEEQVTARVREEVRGLTEAFPLYDDL
jgi:glycine/serine hydroxymethyltransferase